MDAAIKKVYKMRKDKTEFEYDGGALDTLQQDFISMGSKRGKSLTAQTIRSYISKINRIAYMMTNKPYEDYKIFNNADAVIKEVQNSGLKSKKDYLAAISKLLRHKKAKEEVLAKYAQAMGKEKETETKTRGDNLAKKEDVKKTDGMTLKEIQKKINDYDILDNGKIDDAKLINKLLVSFYFMNPYFIPRNDLPEFKIVSINRAKKQLSPDFNYIVIDANKKPIKITMKNYKTKATYGTQSFKVSSELADILQKYLQQYGKTSGEFLFVDRNGKPFKHSNFANLIENAMETILGNGKRIGIDLARQIVLSNMYNDNKIMSINEKAELARAFLHSSNVANEYVRVNLV
jgi:hypothetical protein